MTPRDLREHEISDTPGVPAKGSSGAAGPTPVARPRAGEVLREARARADLSLQEVADRVGCAKSYLSALENAQRHATDEVLARLEAALSLAPGTLIDAARWERGLAAGGEPVRRELERLRADQHTARRLAELLTASKNLDSVYRSGELRTLVERLDPGAARPAGPLPVPLSFEVPLINRVAAGYPREFTDLGYPARIADEYVRCPDLNDADAFAARVVGDSMLPAYAEGDIVIFSPARPVKSGADCFARLEPDHETTFKRIYFERDSTGEEQIRLQPLNAAYPPRTVPRERVAGLYAAVSVMRSIG